MKHTVEVVVENRPDFFQMTMSGAPVPPPIILSALIEVMNHMIETSITYLVEVGKCKTEAEAREFLADETAKAKIALVKPVKKSTPKKKVTKKISKKVTKKVTKRK